MQGLCPVHLFRSPELPKCDAPPFVIITPAFKWLSSRRYRRLLLMQRLSFAHVLLVSSASLQEGGLLGSAPGTGKTTHNTRKPNHPPSRPWRLIPLPLSVSRSTMPSLSAEHGTKRTPTTFLSPRALSSVIITIGARHICVQSVGRAMRF